MMVKTGLNELTLKLHTIGVASVTIALSVTK